MSKATVFQTFIPLVCKAAITLIPHSMISAPIADMKYSLINPFATNADANTQPQWIGHWLDIYPEVDCTMPAGNKFFQGPDNAPAFATKTIAQIQAMVTNPTSETLAEMWMATNVLGDDYFLRIRCARFTVGIVTPLSGSGGSSEYGLTCNGTGASDFNANIWYKNVHPNEAILMSFHACATSTQVPYVVFEAQSKTVVAFKKLNSTATTQPIVCLEGSGDYAVTAVTFAAQVRTKIPLITLGNVPDNKFKAAVANCAYGMINMAYDMTTGGADFDATYTGGDTYTTDAKFGLVCRACKPGFRPTYTLNPAPLGVHEHGAAVVTCTAIVQCDLTNTS